MLDDFLIRGRFRYCRGHFPCPPLLWVLRGSAADGLFFGDAYGSHWPCWVALGLVAWLELADLCPGAVGRPSRR